MAFDQRAIDSRSGLGRKPAATMSKMSWNWWSMPSRRSTRSACAVEALVNTSLRPGERRRALFSILYWVGHGKGAGLHSRRRVHCCGGGGGGSFSSTKSTFTAFPALVLEKVPKKGIP